MAWANEEIAGLLREYAELTQITGGDVFRARNYEKAARSVRGWADDISQLDVKALRAIPGVGASIAAKIAEYRDTGSIGTLEELRAKIPPGVLELTQVPGLGQGLAGFDLCVASVHSHFEQPRAEMTRRFITACENPHVNVIGHPTARRIGKRLPVEVDFGELFRACARTGPRWKSASPQRSTCRRITSARPATPGSSSPSTATRTPSPT